jgi:hypothetical protein
MTSGSGSHDGMLCVWDLLTGKQCEVVSLKEYGGIWYGIYYNYSLICSPQVHVCILFKLMMVR